jgi:hypothetical protein
MGVFLRFSRIKKVLLRSHFSMSAFRPTMEQQYLLKLLNQVAYTEWGCLVSYTLHVMAGFCFRFWVTNPMFTVKELHHLPIDRTIASFLALLTSKPTNPSHFQWNCLRFFRKAGAKIILSVVPSAQLPSRNSVKSPLFRGLFGTATYKVDCTLAPETSFLHH